METKVPISRYEVIMWSCNGRDVITLESSNEDDSNIGIEDKDFDYWKSKAGEIVEAGKDFIKVADDCVAYPYRCNCKGDLNEIVCHNIIYVAKLIQEKEVINGN